MSELKCLNDMVKDILYEDKKARNSDNYLYYKVVEKIGIDKGIDIDTISLSKFLLTANTLNFPPFESVSRARRNLQRKYENLRSDETVERKRNEKQQQYFSFYNSQNI